MPCSMVSNHILLAVLTGPLHGRLVILLYFWNFFLKISKNNQQNRLKQAKKEAIHLFLCLKY
jgi:hypothetical protein